ncbi:hypothetical protein COCMIDRAFT_30160 [Bipolaris oryzae ATCC 44560]|uniref:Uncharacterized protein n=1 Tax=Bipolaris oryzae ATCC 44560 TaxID=930090 RepID=W6YZN1_COCMI|nr:uncharacterized protein COCMIDRAFT_30160 [Bipolaris oryzae ATCC 44560]EUC40994.1 hypothetical protein COCMIDRAFT_30160 [Bipolaris oryzae ATCC 44560]
MSLAPILDDSDCRRCDFVDVGGVRVYRARVCVRVCTKRFICNLPSTSSTSTSSSGGGGVEERAWSVRVSRQSPQLASLPLLMLAVRLLFPPLLRLVRQYAVAAGIMQYGTIFFPYPEQMQGPWCAAEKPRALPVDTEAVAETTSNCSNVHHDGSHGRPREPTSQSSNRQPGNPSNQSAISQSDESDTPTLDLEEPLDGRGCRSVCTYMHTRRKHVSSRGPARQIHGRSSSLARLLPIISPTLARLVCLQSPLAGACEPGTHDCTTSRDVWWLHITATPLGRQRGGVSMVPGPSAVLHTLTLDTQLYATKYVGSKEVKYHGCLCSITYMAGSSPAIHVKCDVRHSVPSAIAQPDLHCLAGPARSAWSQNGNVNMVCRSKSVMHAAERPPKGSFRPPSRRPKSRYQTLDAWLRLDAGVEPIFRHEAGADAHYVLRENDGC